MQKPSNDSIQHNQASSLQQKPSYLNNVLFLETSLRNIGSGLNFTIDAVLPPVNASNQYQRSATALSGNHAKQVHQPEQQPDAPLNSETISGSLSRNIARSFVRQLLTKWQQCDSHSQINLVDTTHKTDLTCNKNNDNHNDINLIYRDLAVTPPTLITQDWVTAAFAKAEARTQAQNSLLRESDALISEVAAANLIVLATPMYN